MIKTRLMTALIALPLVLWVAHLGGWWLFALVALLMLKGQHELLEAARRRGCAPNGFSAYAFGLGLLCVLMLDSGNWELCVALSVLFVMVNLSIEIVKPSRTHFADVGVTLTAFFYVAWLFGYLMAMRGLTANETLVRPAFSADFGWAMQLYLVIVTWMTDPGAYVIGRAAGRRKLCPAVSPKKTVEGSYGGLITAVATSLLVGTIIGLPVVHSAILGVLLGVVGQVGDLAKSVMKREARIKDFGSVFPGHGGVLDRFDAVLFNSVIAYYYVVILLA